MVFSSTVFLFLFLPAVIFFYWLPDACRKIKSFFCKEKPSNNQETSPEQNQSSQTVPPPQPVSWRRYKNLVLLFFSILFYAWGEPAFVLVMLFSIAANYSFGRLIDKYRNHSRKILWTSVAFNIGILFIFKYLCFTLQNIGWIINKDFSALQIALPIGISFFTFQALSYVIDVYNKKAEAQSSLFNLGLYIALFPQLIAGPIVRYGTIAMEIENRSESYDDFAEGAAGFIQGLAKKVIIANNVAMVAEAAFKTPAEELSAAFAWLGAIAYTLQIYFDFSGYSDMAIGLGRMFGFHIPENFNYPYMASSITDFWRRWHISLSNWFRDYVYFPLGGSRVGSKARIVFNLFVVWLLTGIWHGARWTFIVWGLFYFILLLTERMTALDKKQAWWGHIYTMLSVVIAWVLFRSETVSQAFSYISTMFGCTSGSINQSIITLYLSNYKFYLIAGCLLSVKMPFRFTFEINSKPRGIICAIVTMLLFLFSIAFILRDTYNPFIYFNF